MRNRVVSIAILLVGVGLIAAPTASAASPAECEAQEAAARQEALGYGWTAEQADFHAQLAAEGCWEGVREAEWKARVEREDAEEREREEAKEAEREQRAKERQHRQQERTRFIRPPTVTRHEAERATLILLHRYTSWRHRLIGEYECDGGRINRYLWSCKVFWIPPHHHCWRGRVLTEGRWTVDGRPKLRFIFKARDVCAAGDGLL